MLREEVLPDMLSWRHHALFDRHPLDRARARRGDIGVLAALDMHDVYPFWHAFFTHLGFRVVLSKGGMTACALESICSESVCYPAKLAHGHLFDLLERQVPYVFLPLVESIRGDALACPVVAGYARVLSGSAAQISKASSDFISPHISCLFKGGASSVGEAFASELFEELVRRWPDMTKEEISGAAEAGLRAQRDFEEALRAQGARVLGEMRSRDVPGVVLAGHSYHGDPAVHHGISELLRSCGYAVLTDDCLDETAERGLHETYLTMGEGEIGEDSRRILRAAQFVAQRDDFDFVELCSFGCGLDPAVSDCARDILRSAGKMATVLKVDEMCDLSAMRIRIRSMAAARSGVIGNVQ